MSGFNNIPTMQPPEFEAASSNLSTTSSQWNNLLKLAQPSQTCHKLNETSSNLPQHSHVGNLYHVSPYGHKPILLECHKYYRGKPPCLIGIEDV